MKNYIYGIIKKVPQWKLDIKGIDGERVQLINSNNLSAIVSRAKKETYPLTRENAFIHEKVIEEAMRLTTVLPVSFGTVSETKAIKQNFLDEKNQELQEAINSMEGKVQVNLKAIWEDMTLALQEIVQESREISSLRDYSLENDLSLDQMINIGQKVESEINSKKEHLKEEVLEDFKNSYLNYKENSLFGDDVIFNISFLVPREKEKNFVEKVHNLDKRLKKERIFLKYSGPNPLFDFVQLPISLGQELKEIK